MRKMPDPDMWPWVENLRFNTVDYKIKTFIMVKFFSVGIMHLPQSRPSVSTAPRGLDNSGQETRYLEVTATEY